MLSYRHAFHAGNFADVHKHTGLMLALESLCKKDKPFSIIDTHAGAGMYIIDDERALLTGETSDGILRLISFCDNNDSSPAVSRYLSLVKPYINANSYPGSPEIERCFLRENDSLSLVELHSTEIGVLRSAMEREGKDPRIHIHFRDAYEAAAALCPPEIRRGLLMMDPSYEVDSDYRNVVSSLEAVQKKWAEGIKILWYPLLNHRKKELSTLKDGLITLCDKTGSSYFCSELKIYQDGEGEGMTGSGLFFINVPWLLEEQLSAACIFLKKIFHK